MRRRWRRRWCPRPPSPPPRCNCRCLTRSALLSAAVRFFSEGHEAKHLNGRTDGRTDGRRGERTTVTPSRPSLCERVLTPQSANPPPRRPDCIEHASIPCCWSSPSSSSIAAPRRADCSLYPSSKSTVATSLFLLLLIRSRSGTHAYIFKCSKPQRNFGS